MQYINEFNSFIFIVITDRFEDIFPILCRILKFPRFFPILSLNFQFIICVTFGKRVSLCLNFLLWKLDT